MELSISSYKSEVLAAARDYMEAHFPGEEAKYDPIYHKYQYSIGLDREAGVALMEELLKIAPGIDLWAQFFSDVEGRDSSWWSQYTYYSGEDSEGNPCILYKPGSTYWV